MQNFYIKKFAAWPRDRHVGTCPCLLSFLATYKLCSNFQVTTEKDSRFGRAVQTIACHFDAQSKRSRAIWTSGPNDRVSFFFLHSPATWCSFCEALLPLSLSTQQTIQPSLPRQLMTVTPGVKYYRVMIG